MNSKKKVILSSSVSSSIKLFKNKKGRYSSLTLLRSYGSLKTQWKKVAEPQFSDSEQVAGRVHLAMSHWKGTTDLSIYFLAHRWQHES